MRLKILCILATATMIAACTSDVPTTTAGTSSTPVVPRTTRIFESPLVADAGDRVYFAFDSATLSEDAQAVLRRQVATIARFPHARIMIEGHADERGTREYNLALGERRAAAARDFLVQSGAPRHRITTTSFGRERPAVVGATESAWAQNRRAVTVLQ